MSGVTRHYVLAAGGTGGHLLPAFALATELVARGGQVVLITDTRGAAIPGRPASIDVQVLPAGRLAGRNPLAWLRALGAILQGRRAARALIAAFQPTAVIGFGGYPALPALLAAQTLRVATIIHEQNAVLGRVNRYLAPRVDAIATAYVAVARLPQKYRAKVHLVGNPVRQELLDLRSRPFPRFRDDTALQVLVTGGSQGARILSTVVPDGCALLPQDLRSRLRITQQCRPEDIAAARARYAAHGIAAQLGTYFEDMAGVLAAAQLFIGRAGASTIAELTAAGRPAILVPLDIATDDHQTANAQALVLAGGAVAVPQAQFTPRALASSILALVKSAETLDRAAHAAWNCGYPRAVQDLADLVESFGPGPVIDVLRIAPVPPARRQPAPAPGGAV